MRKFAFLLILILSCFLSHSLYADSPLTSTSFGEVYGNVQIVIAASITNGILTEDLSKWLASAENPIAVKMAVINKLGWEIEGRTNSSFFLNYLKKERGYKDEKDFVTNGKDFELLCMAYIKAMENYYEVDDAIILAEKALQINRTNSYAFCIISAMIKAQEKLSSLNEWCEVYNLTNSVRENKLLTLDMNPEAISIIFNYMDLYKDSCGK